MVVDFRREIGSEPAQFGRGWDLPGRVRWYRCAPGAKPLPFLHAFLDPRWEDEHSKEFEGPGCYETPKTYEDQPISVPAGDHYHGTPEQWAYGITEEEWAARGDMPPGPECILLDRQCHEGEPGAIYAVCGLVVSGRKILCHLLPRVLNAGQQIWASTPGADQLVILLQHRPYGAEVGATSVQVVVPRHGGNHLGYPVFTAATDTELISAAIYNPDPTPRALTLAIYDPSTLPSV